MSDIESDYTWVAADHLTPFPAGVKIAPNGMVAVRNDGTPVDPQPDHPSYPSQQKGQ
jgi:hypothetical protein